jgi:hypothetical protein
MTAERGKFSKIQSFPAPKSAGKTAVAVVPTAADHVAILAKPQPRT